MKLLPLLAACSFLSFSAIANDCDIPAGSYTAEWKDLINSRINIAVSTLSVGVNIPEDKHEIEITFISIPADGGRTEIYRINKDTVTFKEGSPVTVKCSNKTLDITFDPVYKNTKRGWYEGDKTLKGHIHFTYSPQSKTLTAPPESCYLHRLDELRESYFTVNAVGKRKQPGQCILQKKTKPPSTAHPHDET